MQYGKQPLFTPDKVFAFSDVQGGADALQALIAKVSPHVGPNDHIVFVGDLSDGGKKLPGVLKTIDGLMKKFPGQVFVIEGNHEQMMMEYFRGNNGLWFGNGGLKTIAQFSEWGLQPDEYYNPLILKTVLEQQGVLHIYENLIPYYETDRVIITHAPLDRRLVGLVGGLDNDPEKRRFFLDKLEMEIKWFFVDDEEENKIPELGKYLICGHQSGKFQGFRHKGPRVFADRAFIDCGGGYRDDRPLIAFQYPGNKIFYSNG